MATVNWPTTGRKVPNDLGEHAALLKAEFDSVSDTVNASLSNSNLLPAGLESRIEKGIEDGIIEARTNGYCPKWSQIDKTIFSKVLLKNITTASALEARDRIPLAQFHGLHKSFDELYSKLLPQSSTTSPTRPAIAASVATQPTPSNNPVNAAPKGNIDRGPVTIPKRAAPAPQEKKDTNEGEEGDSDRNANIRDGQEANEDEDVESGEESSEDSSDVGDTGSDSVGGSETDSESDTKKEGSQDIVGEQGICNVVRDGKGFKTNFSLNIKQQATVNVLEGMTAAELSACIRSSLQTFIDKQQLSRIHFNNQNLLDNGHVNLDLGTETHLDLQQLVGSGKWARDFERLVCPPDVTAYKVSMPNVNISSVKLKSRKEKATTIRMLTSANLEIRGDGQGTRVGPMIRDIYWPYPSFMTEQSSLTVEFLDPEDANCALRRGLFWQSGRPHKCVREEREYKLVRCSRCQAYGHPALKCSAPLRCRKCAGYHHAATCKSKTVKCSSCGGGHNARSDRCPAKLEAKRNLEFPTKPSPQAPKPAAEAQATPSPRVRHSTSAARTQTETSIPSPVSLDAADENIESESEHLLREANPSPDIQPDYASLKREVDDLRRMVTALHPEPPSRTKRQADEAFAGGAEAESSYKGAIPMKRIKREQPSREGSMGL